MKKFLVFLCLFAFFNSSFASTHLLSAEQLKKKVDRFYLWANASFGSGHKKDISALELRKNLNEIFTFDAEHSLNGKKVATSVEDLFKRFAILQTKYVAADIILPYEEIIIDVKRQKVAIRYTKIFTLHNGEKKVFHAMSFFHVRNGKLDEFNQVSSKEEDHL